MQGTILDEGVGIGRLEHRDLVVMLKSDDGAILSAESLGYLFSDDGVHYFVDLETDAEVRVTDSELKKENPKITFVRGVTYRDHGTAQKLPVVAGLARP